jgi:hypothetical protein
LLQDDGLRGSALQALGCALQAALCGGDADSDVVSAEAGG